MPEPFPTQTPLDRTAVKPSPKPATTNAVPEPARMSLSQLLYYVLLGDGMPFSQPDIAGI